MKVAIFSKVLQEQLLNEVRYFFECLHQNQVPYFINDLYYHQLIDVVTDLTPAGVYNENLTSFPVEVDFLISLGGDGTMLDAASYVANLNLDIPVFGINFGRLGFLASIQKEDIETAILALLKKDFVLDKRSLITVNSDTHIFGSANYALNDIAIQKRDDASMMVIHTYLNNEFVCSYWANGLIVATPTGSTAYSLSCGGPIIYPSTNTLVLTPIAPHNLNVRPLIYPDHFELSLKLEGRSAKYLVSCDTKTEIVDNFAQLKITKSDFQINLLRLNNESYLKTLRNKLHWGIDTRN